MPVCHENMIKVGGYILGEFGHFRVRQLVAAQDREINGFKSSSALGETSDSKNDHV